MGGLFQTTPEELPRIGETWQAAGSSGIDAAQAPVGPPKIPATGRLAMFAPDDERRADRPERSVRVRINDRGPWAVDKAGRAIKPRVPHPTRVIDLSRRTFEDLTGNIDVGTANVEILIPNED
jgi:hypothetical protein